MPIEERNERERKQKNPRPKQRVNIREVRKGKKGNFLIPTRLAL